MHAILEPERKPLASAPTRPSNPDIIIRVENLGKKYQLGRGPVGQAGYRTLRESLVEGAQRMLRRGEKAPTEEFWALRDVNFEINRGEVIGIIGRNGAGKSTLLKILSRITDPTTGKIRLAGRIASLLEVGTGFHQELTGRENIFLNGAILGMSHAEIKAKFDEIVAFAEVEKFLDTPVKRYSSGMYVRLAFAVAAHLESDILVIDEVLAVGDSEFQKKCLGKVRDVARGGRTVLLVSHDMNAVHRLCSTAILLEKGRVSAQGRAPEVIDFYIRSFVGQQYDYSRRRGEGGIRLEQLEIVGSSGETTTQLGLFEPATFRFRCTATRTFNSVRFAVCLNTLQELRALSLYSSYHGQDFRVAKGAFIAECTIPYTRLMPGEYKIVTHIEAGGVLLDEVSDLATVSVGLANVRSFLTNPDQRQGFTIEQFDWSVRQEGADLVLSAKGEQW